LNDDLYGLTYFPKLAGGSDRLRFGIRREAIGPRSEVFEWRVAPIAQYSSATIEKLAFCAADVVQYRVGRIKSGHLCTS
jgi:hypothetical protein